MRILTQRRKAAKGGGKEAFFPTTGIGRIPFFGTRLSAPEAQQKLAGGGASLPREGCKPFYAGTSGTTGTN